MNKLWLSCTLAKGTCDGTKIFGSAVCVSLSAFFIEYVFHNLTLYRFVAIAVVDCEARMLNRTRVFCNRTDDCLAEL